MATGETFEARGERPERVRAGNDGFGPTRDSVLCVGCGRGRGGQGLASDLGVNELMIEFNLLIR